MLTTCPYLDHTGPFYLPVWSLYYAFTCGLNNDNMTAVDLYPIIHLERGRYRGSFYTFRSRYGRMYYLPREVHAPQVLSKNI